MTDENVRVVIVGARRHPGWDWRDIRPEFASDEGDLAENLEALMDQLRRERKRQGLTQKALAERMDVTQSRVSAIETGNPETAEVKTLARYFSALGCRLSLIADFGRQAEPSP